MSIIYLSLHWSGYYLFLHLISFFSTQCTECSAQAQLVFVPFPLIKWSGFLNQFPCLHIFSCLFSLCPVFVYLLPTPLEMISTIRVVSNMFDNVLTKPSHSTRNIAEMHQQYLHMADVLCFLRMCKIKRVWCPGPSSLASTGQRLGTFMVIGIKFPFRKI